MSEPITKTLIGEGGVHGHLSLKDREDDGIEAIIPLERNVTELTPEQKKQLLKQFFGENALTICNPDGSYCLATIGGHAAGVESQDSDHLGVSVVACKQEAEERVSRDFLAKLSTLPVRLSDDAEPADLEREAVCELFNALVRFASEDRLFRSNEFDQAANKCDGETRQNFMAVNALFRQYVEVVKDDQNRVVGFRTKPRKKLA